MFNDELNAVKKELTNKAKSLIPWHPKFSGQALWARQLKRRIERGMMVRKQGIFTCVSWSCDGTSCYDQQQRSGTFVEYPVNAAMYYTCLSLFTVMLLFFLCIIRLGCQCQNNFISFTFVLDSVKHHIPYWKWIYFAVCKLKFKRSSKFVKCDKKYSS